MNISKRLQALRAAKGLTVNRLANLSGISQSHLREIELGNKNPTIETLSYFCDALGVSLKEFFTEDETRISPFLRSALEKLSIDQQERLAEFINSMCK